ncbi:Anxa6 protein [Capsaspora owczarzaki ATCC 30864]|uniref:Annexin n=2 Tax=Capsaspora owczarzaki (strain ATCC 30864) TaxID=595528 RepID=A0A0D2WKJ5_CAPO3|nr:Anxa6 protein [Capsaspora owczarzaki ATCC 30864]
MLMALLLPPGAAPQGYFDQMASHHHHAAMPAGAGGPGYPPVSAATHASAMAQMNAAAGGSPISPMTRTTSTSYIASPLSGGAPGSPALQHRMSMMVGGANKPTLLPARNFNAEMDAKALRKAFKGLGTDDRKVISVLTSRVLEQRLAIKQAFDANFGRDFVKDLRGETSGDFRDLLIALLTPLPELDAFYLHKAMKGLGTNDTTVIEIIATRTNGQIRAIREAYSRVYNRDLETDVKSETSGDYRNLLVALLQARREEGKAVDAAAAKADATALYRAGESRVGTDENVFISILATRSSEHLRTVFDDYAKLSDHSFEKTVEREFSFNIQAGLLAIAKHVRNAPLFFAERLYKAMKGMGTDDSTLIRIVVEHCEVDLGNIKDEFYKAYGQTLETFVRGDTSGNYRTALLGLIEQDTFDPEKDAKALRKAMKGVGTNEDKLVDILGVRKTTQRLAIRTTYDQMYARDLIKDLKSETSGNFQQALLTLMMSPAEFDARSLNRAVKGLGTTDSVLMEILCTRSNMELKAIKEAYHKEFSKDFETDLKEDTSGDYRTLLLTLLQGQRSESTAIDVAQAKADATALYNAGEDKAGTDEAVFIRTLTQRPINQLRITFEEYARLCEYDIEKSIKREMSFNLKKALITIVRYVRSAPDYFAEVLHEAMRGIGTNDDTLQRVIITRAENDLNAIRESYFAQYDESLEAAVESETSGDYKRLLLKLVETALDGDYMRDTEALTMIYQEQLRGLNNGVLPPNSTLGFGMCNSRVAVPKTFKPLAPPRATVKPYPRFNADEDAKALRKAMKGIGTNDKKLIQCLSGRSYEQRMAVKKAYETNLSRDLLKDLRSETSGNFRECLVALMMSSAEFDATCLNKAMKGLGTDDTVLIEILCTRSKQQIIALKNAYRTLFTSELEADLTKETSGQYLKLLLALCKAERSDNPQYTTEEAKADAQALYKAGESKVGTNEDVFIEILTQRSYERLRGAFFEYTKLVDYHLEKSIEREFSFNLKRALVTIVRSIRNGYAFFAERLYRSMKGIGTDDASLIRIVVSRSEIDMGNIREEFTKTFKQDLAAMVKGDTSGSYRQLLIELVEEERTSPEEDAKLLRTCFKGLGTNEDKLSQALCLRTTAQRQMILNAYNQMYAPRTIVQDIKSETSGQYRNTLLALMMTRSEYDAESIHESIKGLGTDDSTLIEILCTRSGPEIKAIRESFRKLFSKDMEQEVGDDVSGDFKQLLASLMKGERPDSNRPVNPKDATADAQALYKAGEGKVGTDEAAFITILTQRSFAHIRAVMDEYAKLSQNSLEAAISSEMSFNIKKALTTIIKVVRDPVEYFTARSQAMMKGLGTNDSGLIRMIVTRNEVDLSQIRDRYLQLYGKTLAAAIESETSGDYMRLLLRMVEEPQR